MTSPLVKFAAATVPGQAVAYTAADGTAQLVGAAAPLPVSTQPVSTGALTGNATVNCVAGPFLPVVGRGVILTLTGTWAGSVQVERSVDGGATRVPLTAGGNLWALFSGNCCEAVWDESEAVAQLYLRIQLTSGAVGYRLAQ